MAKDKLTQYDTTASNNTDVGGISVAEGMLPSGVNNAIREQMSHLADFAAGTSGVDVLKLQDDTDTNSIKLQAPASVTTTTTFTMPDGDGSADQVLKTDGSGQLGFADRHANPSLVINGAMSVAQRGTSVTSQTSTNDYTTCDRWHLQMDSSGTFTVSQSTTAPDGFSNSFKIDCTTEDASPNYLILSQRFEGQNLQHLKKGTSNAESVTLSFWVRSSKTGTYQVNLQDIDNTRNIGATYAISSADTWEYKTVTFAGDTTGALDNDNANSLNVEWFLASGSSFNTGAVPTAWEAKSNADRAAGLNVAIGASTSDDWHITGVKLEVGSTATDFVHESYGDTLAKCQRYYQTDGGSRVIWGGYAATPGNSFTIVDLINTMRANPSITFSNNNAANFNTSNPVVNTIGTQRFEVYKTATGTNSGSYYLFNYTVDAEL